MPKLWHCNNMKRNLFFILLSFSLLWASTGFAKDTVPFRISEKSGYDRIVFGWKNAVEYKLRKEGDKLIISFNKAADLEKDIKSGQNIASHTTVSNEPLEVSFTIPKSSKIRDFKIGKRVILDIYDPDNPEDRIAKKPEEPKKKKLEKKAVEVKPKQPQPKKEGVVQKAPEKKEAGMVKTPIREEGASAPAVPPAIVLVPERLPPKADANEEKKRAEAEKKQQAKKKQRAALKKAVKQENHVISVRSTTNVGIAAFEQYGDLWVVMDNDTSLITPNLSSPTPEIFGDLLPVSTNGGSAYRLSVPQDKGLKIQAKGAGLVWDIIIGDKVKAKAAPQPIYQNNSTILFPLYGAAEALNVTHPETGQDLIVVTTSEARQFGAIKQSYAEFEILTSPIGLAVFPKVDNLSVVVDDRGVQISRPEGLNLASAADRKAAKIFKNQKSQGSAEKNSKDGQTAKEDNNLYQFKKWKLGPPEDLTKNQNILLETFPDKSEGRRVEDLITLGKMMLSHGLAAEALGYFSFAADELPGIAQSAEFRALRGAALALDWKNEDALRDLLHKSLKDQDEVKYWASYALADLGDWQQAASVLPKSYKPIYNYPDQIAHKLALSLAEVNLRAGKVNDAKELLSIVESTDKNIISQHKAALKYLKGEAARQKGDKDQTKDLWKKLAQGNDDLYSVRATLALAILESKDNKIDSDELVDRLESIRYAWRGDDLEAQVKYWLGKAYFDKDEFIVGLSIMRDAASISDQTALAKRVARDMAKTYVDLYMGPKLKDVPALEALAVYEQFRELTPIGAQGNKLEQNLAEHLVRSNLFERASKMLRHQVDHRLSGEEKLNIAIRLAEIELIDNNPQKAINALGKATEAMRTLKDYSEKKEKQREIDLLRIRAYAQNKEYDKSLSLLEKLTPSQTVSRFKADIAWKAGYWEDAAKHLNAVIIDEQITPETELSQEQADLILNRAIALNLNDEQISLANMRAKYTQLMEPTKKANQFELITRPRRVISPDDRDALLATVAEVEIFKDFLESYKQN